MDYKQEEFIKPPLSFDAVIIDDPRPPPISYRAIYKRQKELKEASISQNPVSVSRPPLRKTSKLSEDPSALRSKKMDTQKDSTLERNGTAIIITPKPSVGRAGNPLSTPAIVSTKNNFKHQNVSPRINTQQADKIEKQEQPIKIQDKHESTEAKTNQRSTTSAKKSIISPKADFIQEKKIPQPPSPAPLKLVTSQDQHNFFVTTLRNDEPIIIQDSNSFNPSSSISMTTTPKPTKSRGGFSKDLTESPFPPPLPAYEYRSSLHSSSNSTASFGKSAFCSSSDTVLLPLSRKQRDWMVGRVIEREGIDIMTDSLVNKAQRSGIESGSSTARNESYASSASSAPSVDQRSTQKLVSTPIKLPPYSSSTSRSSTASTTWLGSARQSRTIGTPTAKHTNTPSTPPTYYRTSLNPQTPSSFSATSSSTSFPFSSSFESEPPQTLHPSVPYTYTPSARSPAHFNTFLIRTASQPQLHTHLSA
ncbi:uncharacterized protein MONOS_10649 [Monocercomonoides exilis]|uniref:uncharacterized protein n=1 Tax=Monocercomonoides exilis TaxID=2049356 RepID=UPI00355A0976|nr:hypothetical protein MONOS_10649 [Monocercomonoides exilis]|eukprot:MONOS_10649.1-p1 / transcript=MONOS_10649.1 / gene=MONOS_10649 / organism=Monocercomonoides_exilis_PA203 / gene_product=unspecified product / transcript_product=unspecified product / location=Mono_scaffold00492:25949-27443(-) / protein_length=476 / sequence_SO=supercontig / SO=protein_coding / is_pseudo=false